MAKLIFNISPDCFEANDEKMLKVWKQTKD